MQEYIRRPTFSIGTNDKLKWCLRVHPNVVDEESTDYLSVYLVLLSCSLWAKFHFCIISTEGEKTQSVRSPRALRFLPGYNWGFKKFILPDFLLSHSHWLSLKTSLILLCKMSMV